LRKTSGLTEVLRDALSPLAEQIETPFVFGSVAGGQAGNDSDIDLM
jgi:predicted nucleotidyltransferase